MDTGNVDMAKTMAEVFAKGDANKDEKLNKQEFVNVSWFLAWKEIFCPDKRLSVWRAIIFLVLFLVKIISAQAQALSQCAGA